MNIAATFRQFPSALAPVNESTSGVDFQHEPSNVVRDRPGIMRWRLPMSLLPRCRLPDRLAVSRQRRGALTGAFVAVPYPQAARLA